MITSFRDEYDFLSNFYPFQIKFENEIYDSVEYAYQAAKTIDPLERTAISRCRTAGVAKKYGQSLSLRAGWELMRLPIMEFLVRQKFSVNSVLTPKLVATYPQELIEGNNWDDIFWGAVWNGVDWYGKNHLGKILMKIRQEHLWR